MTFPQMSPDALWVALPLFLLAAGLGAAEAIILNLRGRTRARGQELRWACGAMGAAAMLSTFVQTPVLFAFPVSIAVSLTLIAVSRLRAEWRDLSRETLT